VSNPFGSVVRRTAKLLVISANDRFAAALLVPALGGRLFSDNRNASKEAGEPDHAGNHGGRSVWFSWTASVSGSVIVDTFGSTFDTLLGVYQGTNVASLTLVAANDDGAGFGGNNSQVVFAGVAGNTYTIAVDGYDGASGAVRLNLGYEQPVLTVQLLAPTGPLRIDVCARAQAVVVVETSPDLSTWTPLTTNLVPSDGVLRLTDDLGAGERQRFYRVVVR
jgi:predicted dehydrogenase